MAMANPILKGSQFKEKGKYEVFFPRNFSTDHPWGEKDLPATDKITQNPKLSNPSYEMFKNHPQTPFTFELSEERYQYHSEAGDIFDGGPMWLMHITHDEEADEISSGKDKLNFKAFEKHFSRNYSYEVADPGPTCLNSTYKACTSNGETLPGRFVWWSMDFRNPTPQVSSKTAVGYKIVPKPTFWFQNSHQTSFYGNKKFTAKFKDLCDSYKRLPVFAGGDQSRVKVLLKKAGTLRYVKEIEYVIIVCASIDDEDPFPQYETLALPAKLHITKPHHEIEYQKDGKVWYHYNTSYDHYAFAFHFPAIAGQQHPPASFEIPKDKVHMEKCRHLPEWCYLVVKKWKKCQFADDPEAAAPEDSDLEEYMKKLGIN